MPQTSRTNSLDIGKREAAKRPPRQFADIEPEIIDGVDYAVRFGRTSSGSPKPSNIIKVCDSGSDKSNPIDCRIADFLAKFAY